MLGAAPAAVAAGVVLGGLVCFQLLLAAGWPLGHYAWGGGHRILPAALRIGSLVASALYVLAALALLEAAGVIDLVEPSSELPRNAAWVLAGLFALGTLMNAISRSRKERRMAVVAGVLSVMSMVVARGVQ